MSRENKESRASEVPETSGLSVIKTINEPTRKLTKRKRQNENSTEEPIGKKLCGDNDIEKIKTMSKTADQSSRYKNVGTQTELENRSFLKRLFQRKKTKVTQRNFFVRLLMVPKKKTGQKLQAGSE